MWCFMGVWIAGLSLSQPPTHHTHHHNHKPHNSPSSQSPTSATTTTTAPRRYHAPSSNQPPDLLMRALPLPCLLRCLEYLSLPVSKT